MDEMLNGCNWEAVLQDMIGEPDAPASKKRLTSELRSSSTEPAAEEFTPLL